LKKDIAMMKATFATASVSLAAAVLSIALPAHATTVAHPHAAQTIQVPHVGAGLMPPNQFFEVYPTPEEMLINLINNPPNCNCDPFTIGASYASFLKVLGNPSSLRGNTASWSNTTEGAIGSMKIGSKEKLTVTFDANGLATTFHSDFQQSALP
jgi:hypothetical protein